MMLPLKYLFDNPALAKMLLDNWEYDPSSLDLFQYFRISANAIYPFKHNNTVCFLRFSPAQIKPKEQLLAELDFLRYLQENNYPVMQAVPSKNGMELLQKSTPWGEFNASVFQRVKGVQISETIYDQRVLFAYGAALGRLHQLSSRYTPTGAKRWTHTAVLDWCETTLKDLGAVDLHLQEIELLRNAMSALPVTPQNYGLIHYDFEPDNVFFDDQTGACSVIDFDDTMYHWYGMDITQALASLREEFAEEDFPNKQAVFMEGYRSEFETPQDLQDCMPVFRRFANAYQYTRVSLSVRESWDNEPEWMLGLRAKLNGLLARNAGQFGTPL
jgi:Ser/Thr protein kinase RdoA (MazF antagonist)